MTAVTLESLARRVQELEDIGAIKDLKSRYWRACDLKQPAVVRDCFDPAGAVIDYEGFPAFDNRDAFTKTYETMACRPGLFDLHHGCNPEIELTGPDTAKAKWSLAFYTVDVATRTAINMGVEYNDEYIKKAGRWLIKKTVARRVSFTMEKYAADGTPTVLTFGNEGPKVYGEALKA